VDAKIAAGRRNGLLAGIPVASRNMCTKRIPTTCASDTGKFCAAMNQPVTKNWRGQLMVGKTNFDEFAMGSSTENSAYQVTANPWDVSRVQEVLQVGSAACSSRRLVALGSGYGGSVNLLHFAAWNKTTYGLVLGLVWLPLLRLWIKLDLLDAQLKMQRFYWSKGHDPKDSTSLKVDIPTTPISQTRY